MNKKISKSIMQRTGFRNKFPKNPSNESRHIYTKQHETTCSADVILTLFAKMMMFGNYLFEEWFLKTTYMNGST